MKKLLAVLLPLALGAVLVNCGTKEETKTTPAAAAVTFDGSAKAAFAASCVGCHSATGTQRGGVILDTFAGAKAAAAKVKKVLDGTGTVTLAAMGATISDANKKIVTDWVDGGALEK